MHDPFLIGRRLYLRLLDAAADAPSLLRWWNHPQCRAHQPDAMRPVTELSQIRALQPEDALHLGIVLVEGDSLAGVASLRGIDPFQRRAELYVLVQPDWQRRHLAHEAAALLLGHGFDRLGLDFISARLDAGHEAGRGLAERLGFEPVATLPGWNLRAGKRTDELVLALSRERHEHARAGLQNPWSN
jgi:RimJ/RimL family protein N-acetyltransferase